ncbi:MAG: hypothetical protein HQ536_01505 [Parcubacteria group bacterium]|nr:hypothetical protein [Parcubacteria group bacterium]
MSQRIYSRPNKRYLGNDNHGHMEVHDLINEQPRCQIDEIIRAGHAVIFSPDTLSQAHSEGYDNCAHCIGNSLR